MQRKSYDSEKILGRAVWSKVQLNVAKYAIRYTAGVLRPEASEQAPLYGSEYLRKARLGQSTFRALVIDAYDRGCAVTSERTMPVLETAQIKPFARQGPNNPQNGLLLRADLHILFDQRYFTVTDRFDVELSRRIKEEFENGREYYALHGHALKVIPHEGFERPSREFLEWHKQNVYRG